MKKKKKMSQQKKYDHIPVRPETKELFDNLMRETYGRGILKIKSQDALVKKLIEVYRKHASK